MHESENDSALDAPTEAGNLLDEPNRPIMTSTSPAKTRKALLHGFVTFSSAEKREEDMRAELQYITKMSCFYDELESQKEDIQKLVASHCGLPSPDLVRVPEMWGPDNQLIWLHGSFNICIPISIVNAGPCIPAKIGLRVPLPYKVGEETFPGNAEEKVRSEAATYIWISKHCPDIPIPKLQGFGFPGGLSVSLYFLIPFPPFHQ